MTASTGTPATDPAVARLASEIREAEGRPESPERACARSRARTRDPGRERRTRRHRLAAGADHLFIEAAFLHRDRALAEATRHLTARAAGEIARAAGVNRVTPFHFSGRYLARSEEIAMELSDGSARQAQIGSRRTS